MQFSIKGGLLWKIKNLNLKKDMLTTEEIVVPVYLEDQIAVLTVIVDSCLI